jgi:ABC-type multidrug transport system fused ATPase/permease subunit
MAALNQVDFETDALIQRTIEAESRQRGWTLLTIAHRLQTIMDYNTIVEIDRGQCVGHASPRALLADPQVCKTPSWPRSWARFKFL